MKLSKISTVTLALVMILGIVSGCVGSHTITTEITIEYGNKIGNLAFDFSLPDLKGNTVTLSSFKGRPVIVNFWSTG